MRGVGNTVLEAAAIGDVPIISYVDGKAREGVLKDVLYVPGLGVNLYSIGKASALGIEINFLFEGVDFKHNGDRIMSGQRVGDSLYYLNITLKNSTDALMGISSAPEHPCVISLENQLITDMPTVQGRQPTKGGRDPIFLLAQPLGLVRKKKTQTNKHAIMK